MELLAKGVEIMCKEESGERSKISGERLKIARQMREMTQDELAEKLGVGRLVIYHAEAGRRVLKADVAARVCEVLAVDANWLLGVQPKDYIWDGVMYRTDVEALPASTGKTYTPLGEQEQPDA
jgi:transcriptional regulator with XRE-family HTH domain